MNKLELAKHIRKMGIKIEGGCISKRDAHRLIKKLKARHGKGLKENFPAVDAEVKKLIESAKNKIEEQYETFGGDISEIEHESRDGFISSNDGGYRWAGFTNINILTGTGTIDSLPAKAKREVEALYEEGLKYAKEEFAEKHGEYLKGKKIPEDKWDYHGLVASGEGKLAEELSELEDEQNSDDNSTVMFEALIMFHYPDSFTVQTAVNWEAPYHRSKSAFEDYFEEDVDVSMENPAEVAKTLKNILAKGLKHIGAA